MASWLHGACECCKNIPVPCECSKCGKCCFDLENCWVEVDYRMMQPWCHPFLGLDLYCKDAKSPEGLAGAVCEGLPIEAKRIKCFPAVTGCNISKWKDFNGFTWWSSLRQIEVGSGDKLIECVDDPGPTEVDLTDSDLGEVPGIIKEPVFTSGRLGNKIGWRLRARYHCGLGAWDVGCQIAKVAGEKTAADLGIDTGSILAIDDAWTMPHAATGPDPNGNVRCDKPESETCCERQKYIGVPVSGPCAAWGEPKVFENLLPEDWCPDTEPIGDAEIRVKDNSCEFNPDLGKCESQVPVDGVASRQQESGKKEFLRRLGIIR